VLFFNEWRAASRAAAAAERMVSEAFMLYFNGKGDPPTDDQVREAKRRRGVADDLFALSVQNWNDGRDKRQTPQE
jgi:hypothetical protein